MFKSVLQDIDTYFDRDPAARTRLEVMVCYPGFHAICFYRLSHKLWGWNLKLMGRFVSQLGRFFTGIEIHPAANIGRGLFIDHGLGVVIGETASIGNNVTIYHDVTLGGTSWNQGVRHPQIGDDVIIGAGAQLLGPIIVGEGARIGSNSVVVKDVPENTTVVGIPAHEVKSKQSDSEADHFDAYATSADEQEDPLVVGLREMEKEMERLNARVKELEALNQAMSNDGEEGDPDWETNCDIKH